jgi:SAM-dependent methyltransferase
VDPLILPLPDGLLDRVLVVHALEFVSSPSELLHEVARLLAPGGRVMLICPNRRGLWARMDTTPFGYGQPFSRSQLRRLMRDAMLSPESWAETLYVPPLRNRLLLRGAGVWERLGLDLSLPFAGLHVVEATKQLHRPAPIRAVRVVERRRPVLVPATASPTMRTRQ